MDSFVSVITLAVNDLPSAVDFYQQVMGLTTRGIVGDPENDTQVAFFTLSGHQQLALWPQSSLQRQLGEAVQGTGGMLSHNVSSQAAVDRLIASAQQAGARIVKAPHWQPWGCYGSYFCDPEGHYWEITFNPKRALS